MKQRIMWAALVGLTTTLVGCAYGVKPEPDDDDYAPGDGWELSPAEQEEDTIVGNNPGSCYADLGACNPMTGSCGLGEACDVGSSYQFQCFAPPNNAMIGQSCDAAVGPFCSHGSMCLEGVCRAFCCGSNDCFNATCRSYVTDGYLSISLCVP